MDMLAWRIYLPVDRLQIWHTILSMYIFTRTWQHRERRMGWPEIVRALRRGCGGKQEGLSLLLGVSQATISRWESGRQVPGAPVRDRLLDLYARHVEAVRAEMAEGGADTIARHLFRSASVGMVVADSDRILDANDAFLTMVGYGRNDLVDGGIDWVALTPPEYADIDRRALEEVLQSGGFAPYEKEYWRKDGGRVTVLLAGSVIQQAPLLVAACVIDLSSRLAGKR